MKELRRMFPENNPQQKLEATFRYLNRITGKRSLLISDESSLCTVGTCD